MSHDTIEALDGMWEETDGECDGSAHKLYKQNRTRSQQGNGKQRLARRRVDGYKAAYERPAVRRQRPNQPEEFRCRHCRALVGPVPSGGRHRNHCPVCLHSRHVDLSRPGDRLSPCGGTMAPVGAFVRLDGEHGLVHRCLACGVQRQNRIAADDDFSLVLALSDLTRWMPDRRIDVYTSTEDTA